MSGGQKGNLESKNSEKSSSPEPPKAAEQVSELQSLVRASKGMAPGDLPNESNNRSLRQLQLLQLQRQQGNQFVQRYLDGGRALARPALGDAGPQFMLQEPALLEPATALPVANPSIQRKIGGEVGTGGIKVELKPEKALETEIKMSYAKATLGLTGSVMAELKPKEEPSASVSVSDEGGKATVNVYKREAEKAGSDAFANLAREHMTTDGWTVDKVDWDVVEVGAGEEEGAGKASVATGVKFTFVNGQEAVVKATLVESSAKEGLSGPSLSVTPTIKFPEVALWENKDAKLTFSGEVKFEMKLKPDWAKIFQELATRGGRAVAQQFARAAMQGMVEFFLGAGGFVAGALLTIGAAYLEMDRISEIKECRQAAESAAEGYVHGYCIAWGIEDYGTAGADKWFHKGIGDGRDRLQEMIRKIQAHEIFAAYKFTEDELRPALKARLKTRPADVYRQVESESKTRIYREYVLAFYNKRKQGFFSSYTARKDAKWVAIGLGFKDTSFIPED